jgi:hypothetical protein
MYKYGNTLNLNQLYTNSIYAMAEHYGIEAAYQAIIKVISTHYFRNIIFFGAQRFFVSTYYNVFVSIINFIMLFLRGYQNN